MPGVLYKRSPPPPEPEDDPNWRFPVSPVYQFPEYGTMPDYIVDKRGLNTHLLDDDSDRDLKVDIPTYRKLEDDSSYPRRPTSPSYECSEYQTMADYIPDERGPNTHLTDRGTPMYDIADNFDSLYNDNDKGISKEDIERQTNEFATAALHHYNSQEKNMIKYELIKGITSASIMDGWRLYGHVNFTAKSSLENSKEEFFFAELCVDYDGDIYVPTCIISLEENERIGGVRGIKGNYGEEIRVDTQRCYACQEELMHPEDGALYEIGHHVDDYYGSCCN